MKKKLIIIGLLITTIFIFVWIFLNKTNAASNSNSTSDIQLLARAINR